MTIRPGRLSSHRAAGAVFAAALACAAAGSVQAQGAGARPGSATDWQFGAVLDLGHSSRALALGTRDQGLQLGHSDLTASGPLGSGLRAHVGAVLATHDRKLEREIEEAWIETTRLPAGLQLRAGRFASQIGYLNQQHPHADDFSERPLLYRAFYGGHWNDDGLRLNWTAPTPFYLMVGVEALRGKRLVEEIASRARRVGVTTVVAKVGADIGRSSSWQLGLSHIRNTREAAIEIEEEEHEDEEHEHGHGHEHEHGHGARFSGRRTWLVDATWKWSPGGNNRGQQVRLSIEAARISGLNRFAGAGDRHEAHAVSVVWRFHPSWELGARLDHLRVRQPHEDHFESARLRERSVMVVWKPSHQQALRLQFTQQRDAVGLEGAVKRAAQVQYVLAFGAHGAHAY